MDPRSGEVLTAADFGKAEIRIPAHLRGLPAGVVRYRGAAFLLSHAGFDGVDLPVAPG